MASNSITIVGKSELLKELAKFGNQAREGVAGVTRKTSEDMAVKAKELAPVNIGKLGQGIKAEAETDLVWKVFSKEKYSAYVEFGTGTKVKVPPEWQSLANEFRDKSSGTFANFLKDITLWCSRKGIDPKLAYVIAMSILKKGIEPQPFLYPSFKIAKANYPKELEKLLEALTKKYK